MPHVTSFTPVCALKICESTADHVKAQIIQLSDFFEYAGGQLEPTPCKCEGRRKDCVSYRPMPFINLFSAPAAPSLSWTPPVRSPTVPRHFPSSLADGGARFLGGISSTSKAAKMSGSEDEREDFGAADEPSLLHGKLASLNPLKKVHLSVWASRS